MSFNNNEAQSGGTGPYDYIGSPQHAEAMRFEHEQALNRERNNGNARFQDGVTYGANAAWANANVQINQLKREREQLILQVQGLQAELNRVSDVFNETVDDAKNTIAGWKKLTSDLDNQIDCLKEDNAKLTIENEAIKKQTSGSEELNKVIKNLQEANKNMLTELRALRRNNEMTERDLAHEIKLREVSAIFISSFTSMINDLLMDSNALSGTLKARFDEHYSTQLNLAIDLGLVHENDIINGAFTQEYPTTAALINVLMTKDKPVLATSLATELVSTADDWHEPTNELDYLANDDPLDPNYNVA